MMERIRSPFTNEYNKISKFNASSRLPISRGKIDITYIEQALASDDNFIN